MKMLALTRHSIAVAFCLALLAPMLQADDHYLNKKTSSIAGSPVSNSEIWLKGARERTLSGSPAGNVITLWQGDLKRTVTINEQSQGPAAQMQSTIPGANTGSSAPVPLPQALAPKAPGKIRVGIAPAQAQMGQGNNAQADYGTPIRDAIVYIMNGPAVEITPLDSRLPIQLQAEARQKQCDYILLSGVTVKRSSGGFGSFMKKAGPITSMIPMAGMAGGAGGAMAGQVAGMAAQVAAQTAQEQSMNQLSGFNGQIKSKDDVTVEYHLYPTGQDKARLESSLKGKAKSDGEDVLTPLIQQAANAILTDVTKK